MRACDIRDFAHAQQQQLIQQQQQQPRAHMESVSSEPFDVMREGDFYLPPVEQVS